MNLERSTLERKDRAELATIAETLGRKPAARARKSDIVDLILELTGVVPAPQAEPVPAPDAEAASSDTGVEPASESAEPAGTVGDQPAAAADSDQASRSPAPIDASNRARPGRTAPASDTASPDASSRDASSPIPATSSASEGSTPWPDADGEQEGDGDADNPNRRRRRRRGRERDRPGVEAQEDTSNYDGEPIAVSGVLDLRDEGYGFLRVAGLLPSHDDVYVSVKQCRQLGLRRGDLVAGQARPAGRQEKNPAIIHVDEVNGGSPEASRGRPRFEDLTPLFPDERLRLEHTPLDMTTRIIDLVAPIGKGQRGLIVSPPKAGKTSVVKSIATAIEANHPEIHLIMLLVDERPEEVTDVRRSVKGEVIASTFDRPTEEHISVAELTIERAKRLVEAGHDVVIILDGITRLARAYNLAAPASGRVMTGGIDTAALYPPKKFFGAARNVEEGGSLTILATALVDTGSKMDEVIFEEFKGTGNMELRLDRRLAEQRIYPAIDVAGSSTRHEELLFDGDQLGHAWRLRRMLAALASEGSSGSAIELLVDRLKRNRTNADFLAEVAKSG